MTFGDAEVHEALARSGSAELADDVKRRVELVIEAKEATTRKTSYFDECLLTSFNIVNIYDISYHLRLYNFLSLFEYSYSLFVLLLDLIRMRWRGRAARAHQSPAALGAVSDWWPRYPWRTP